VPLEAVLHQPVFATAQIAVRELPELDVELAWQPFVIGVEQREMFAARRGHRGVARSRRAAIFLVLQHAQARVAETFEHTHRVVSRSVIDGDHFPIGEGLRAHARRDSAAAWQRG
jgi:hypothetical protein